MIWIILLFSDFSKDKTEKHVSLVVENKYWSTKKHTSLVSVPKSPFMKNVYSLTFRALALLSDKGLTLETLDYINVRLYTVKNKPHTTNYIYCIFYD